MIVLYWHCINSPSGITWFPSMAFIITGACLKHQDDRKSVSLSSNKGGWSEIGTINCVGRFAL